MIVTRLTYEFFGAVPLAPFDVEAELVKPGKAGADRPGLDQRGRPRVMRVRAMRMRRAEAGIAAGPPAGGRFRLTGQRRPIGQWPGVQGTMFHPSSMEIRLVGGGRHGSGAATPGSASCARSSPARSRAASSGSPRPPTSARAQPAVGSTRRCSSTRT